MGAARVKRLTQSEREDREGRLSRLNEVLRTRKLAGLDKLSTNKNYVPGRGPMNPSMVFVGEAPGRNENVMREPFIGPSGRLLRDMMDHISLPFDDVYITNTVKWWPTDERGNTRPPTNEEKSICLFYLQRELSILSCARVVALGKHAATTLLGARAVRAKWQVCGLPILPRRPVYVLPLYHPAAALYQQSLKPVLFQEFEMVRKDPRAA